MTFRSRNRRISTRILGLLAATALLTACSREQGPEKSLEVAAQGLYSAAISASGELAVAGSIVHGGSLWRINTAERLFDWNHRPNVPSKITAAAFSPGGDYAVTVEHQEMVLWDTRSGGSITWFAAPSEILDIALTPGATHAVLGLVDHTAVLFDIRRGGGNLRVFNHEGRVRSVSMSADGQRLLTGSEDATARLWDVMSGEEVQRWQHSEAVQLVALSPLGDRAMSASKYDRAVIWDTETGAEIGALPLRRTRVARGVMFTVAEFSADSARLLTGTSDRRVQLWSSSGLRELASWTLPKRKTWKPTGAAVMAVGFAADANSYVVASGNGFVHRVRMPP